MVKLLCLKSECAVLSGIYIIHDFCLHYVSNPEYTALKKKLNLVGVCINLSFLDTSLRSSPYLASLLVLHPPFLTERKHFTSYLSTIYVSSHGCHHCSSFLRLVWQYPSAAESCKQQGPGM